MKDKFSLDSYLLILIYFKSTIKDLVNLFSLDIQWSDKAFSTKDWIIT